MGSWFCRVSHVCSVVFHSALLAAACSRLNHGIDKLNYHERIVMSRTNANVFAISQSRVDFLIDGISAVIKLFVSQEIEQVDGEKSEFALFENEDLTLCLYFRSSSVG